MYFCAGTNPGGGGEALLVQSLGRVVNICACDHDATVPGSILQNREKIRKRGDI